MLSLFILLLKKVVDNIIKYVIIIIVKSKQNIFKKGE